MSRDGWSLGVFVTLGLILLGLTVFAVGNFQLGRSGYALQAEFGYAGGIKVGSPVMVNGVRVGQVENLHLVEDTAATRVRLGLWIRRDIRIRRGAHAYIANLGFLGEKYVDIQTGTPGADPLPEGAVIPGRDPTRIESLVKRLHGVMGDIEVTLSEVNQILQTSDVEEPIRRTAVNLATLTEDLKGLVGNNRGKVGDILSDARTTLRNLRRTTDALNKTSEKVGPDIQASARHLREFGRAMADNREKIQEILKGLNRVTIQLEQLTRKAQLGDGLVSKALNDPVIGEELERIIKNLSALSKDLRKHPWKLLRKP